MSFRKIQWNICWCNFYSLVFTPLGSKSASGSVWKILGSRIRICLKTYADPKHWFMGYNPNLKCMASNRSGSAQFEAHTQSDYVKDSISAGPQNCYIPTQQENWRRLAPGNHQQRSGGGSSSSSVTRRIQACGQTLLPLSIERSMRSSKRSC